MTQLHESVPQLDNLCLYTDSQIVTRYD